MRTCDRTPLVLLIYAALGLTIGAPVDASERSSLIALSPGARERPAAAPHRCPTFTWAGGAAGEEVELALWHVSDGELDPAMLDNGLEPDAEPRWRIRLPAGAAAWSAAGETCLASAGTYAWRLRPAAGREPESWTPPRWLFVPERPTEAEVEAALALLERWRESAAGGVPGRPGRRTRAVSRRLAPPAKGGAPGLSRLGPTSATALEAELPDTGVETFGVVGRTNSVVASSAGVYGESTQPSGEAAGVLGYASSPTGTGVAGFGALGLTGTSDVDGGIGVRGAATGDSASYGTLGETWSAAGFGAAGWNSATTGNAVGVYGSSDSAVGRGVLGEVITLSGAANGVRGYVTSTSGTGVYGLADAPTGFTFGVFGLANSSAGVGTYGSAASATGNTFGVIGRSASPTGVGVSGWGAATTGLNRGMYGVTDSTAGTGVLGYASTTTGATSGVEGRTASSGGYGVLGFAGNSTGVNVGVYGRTNSAAGWSGFFEQTAGVGANLQVTGTITKGGGGFKIDHPLDPANRFLLHSFVESPEMLNLYNGIVELDVGGGAWVEMPDWFETLNRDFRYHLTPIGYFAPLFIEQELSHGRFRIGGGVAGQRVSWMVTGVRQDPFANLNRIPVEAAKSPEERGTYLHPEALGFGPQARLGSLPRPPAAFAEVPGAIPQP